MEKLRTLLKNKRVAATAEQPGAMDVWPNPEHLTKLMEGVEAWNNWMEENPDVEFDFREADLTV